MRIAPDLDVDDAALTAVCDRYGIAELGIFGPRARGTRHAGQQLLSSALLLFTPRHDSLQSEWCGMVKVIVQLDPGVPDRYRRVLATVPEFVIHAGSESRIGLDGADRRLVVLGRPQVDSDPGMAARLLADLVPRGGVGLAVARAIPVRERDALEAAGLSWCDGRGALHLTWPGTLIHIERGGRRTSREQQGAPAGLGPAGIRAVQVLLDVTDSEWTVSRLAQEAGISTGQAHNVFRALDQSRLVRSFGKGPQQRRVISDRRAALDWLASVDLARRRPEVAATYLYGRTDDQVVQRFAERASRAGLPYAVTGALGSQLLGVPLFSRITVAQVRVGVLDAAEALRRLDLEHVDADGPGQDRNLELWTDGGELGTFRASVIDGIRVAPAVRVWLDLARQGGRSEDAAQLFREQVLERT